MQKYIKQLLALFVTIQISSMPIIANMTTLETGLEKRIEIWMKDTKASKELSEALIGHIRFAKSKKNASGLADIEQDFEKLMEIHKETMSSLKSNPSKKKLEKLKKKVEEINALLHYKYIERPIERTVAITLDLEKILKEKLENTKDPKKIEALNKDLDELQEAVKKAENKNSDVEHVYALEEVADKIATKHEKGFFRILVEDAWDMTKNMGKSGVYNVLTTMSQRVGHSAMSKLLFKNNIKMIPEAENIAALALESILLSKGSNGNQNGCDEVFKTSVDKKTYKETLNIHKKAVTEFYKAYLQEKGLDVNKRDRALIEHLEADVSNDPRECVGHVIQILSNLSMYGNNILDIHPEKFYKDLLYHLADNKKTIPQLLRPHMNKKRVAAVLLSGAATGLAAHYALRDSFKTSLASDTADSNFKWALAQTLLPFDDNSIGTPMLKMLGLSEPYAKKIQRLLSLGLSWRFVINSTKNFKVELDGEYSFNKIMSLTAIYFFFGIPQATIRTCIETAEELNITPRLMAAKNWVIKKISSLRKKKCEDPEGYEWCEEDEPNTTVA